MSKLIAIAIVASAACSATETRPTTPRVPDRTGCAQVDPSFENVMLTGHWRGKDVLVLVDTGAKSGSISPALVKELGLTPRPGEKVRYAGASGQFKDANLYDVAGLSLGGTTLAPFAAHDMGMMDGSYDLAIGLDNLAPYIVDFKLADDWFCLRDRLPDEIEPARLAPMTVVEIGDHKLYEINVTATIAGRSVPAMIFDTGAGVSTINETLLATIPHRRLGNKVESMDGSGVVKAEYFVQVNELCTLDVCEPRQILMPGADLSPVVGHHQNGIVGVPWMRNHRIILDLPRRRIAVSP